MFKFKGISSTDMQVIIEEEELFMGRASQRYEKTEIEGRDGALYDALGYSDFESSIYVQCLNLDLMDDILAWLNGEGELEYKGRKTKACFYSSLEPKRKACIKTIDASFVRSPFWDKANDEYVTVTDNARNEGNIASRPTIKLIKTSSNSVDISVNGTRFIYNFLEDDNVEIDCNEKTVEYNGLNRNRQIEIGYDFPTLDVGDNDIIFNSGTCQIQIKLKDRWL